MTAKVLCEICRHHVCNVDPAKIEKPLTADMFTARHPTQYPMPWRPGTEWLFLICPVCRRRAFTRDDTVITSAGPVTAGEPWAHLFKAPEEVEFESYNPEPPKTKPKPKPGPGRPRKKA